MLGIRRHRHGPEGDAAQAWTRAVDRLDRAVRRYVDTASGMRDRTLRVDLLHVGLDLESAAADFAAAGAERGAAAAGRDASLMAAVHRAATLCSHATESAMTAADATRRPRADRPDAAARHLDGVRILVKGVRELADGSRPPG